MGALTWTNRPRTAVIDTGAVLANNARAAADYDNKANSDLACNAILTVQWNTSAPAVGDRIAELWVLPGDDAGTEAFPEGGDGTTGSDDDPQQIFSVGVFVSVNPSTSVDEELTISGIPLYFAGNRFVFRNNSGQEQDLTWQLDIVPYTTTIA